MHLEAAKKEVELKLSSVYLFRLVWEEPRAEYVLWMHN
jgi:hypothetical protein